MNRTPFLLPLAACAVLALAACGSSPGGAGTSDQDTAYENALKWAGCMRDHGVQVPDPERGPNGGILMKAGGPGKGESGTRSVLGPDNPKFKAADKACAKYRVDGGGHAPSPAEQAKRNDALIGYARCMRGKGIDFADPKISGNRVSMSLGRGTRPDSPKFKAADKACHSILAAVEPKGSPSGASGPATQVGR